MSKHSHPTEIVKQKYNWLLISIGIIFGIGLGFLIHVQTAKVPKRLEGMAIRNPDPVYPLINSLLGYDNAEATNFGQLIDFKKKIADLVKQEVDQNNASKITVYFRDLNIGRWISINEDEKYSPASLLKVPLMLAYYHLAETDPTILNKYITFDGKYDADNEQNIKPLHMLEVGKSYTVDQLINEMIVYSDNNSMNLLLNNMDPKVLQKTYTDLDVFLPTSDRVVDFISVKNYALFFRVLYGSTYLDHSDSEKALELLSKSAFKDALVSGVPSDIKVAHKFGERLLLDPTKNTPLGHEFHDCGIVYYPNQPYLLCVMTKGDDFTDLQKSISDISKLIYTEAQNNYN